MMLWENSERERRAIEIMGRTSFEDDNVISPQTSDIDFPLPHQNPSQTEQHMTATKAQIRMQTMKMMPRKDEVPSAMQLF
jgi:hypothetical protein